MLQFCCIIFSNAHGFLRVYPGCSPIQGCDLKTFRWVLAVVLLGTCASALRIESRNLNCTLTVFAPPGCCSSCVPTTDTACSGVCEQCGYAAVGVGEGVTLDSHVGYFQYKVQ